MEKASGGKSLDKGTLIDFTKLEVPKDEDDVFHCNELPTLLSCCNNENTDIIKFFLNLPALQEIQCPIDPNQIQNLQLQDNKLLAMRLQRPNMYPTKEMYNGTLLICTCDNAADAN